MDASVSDEKGRGEKGKVDSKRSLPLAEFGQNARWLRMAATVDSLRSALSTLNLETRGNKDALKSRLRNALSSAAVPPPPEPSPPRRRPPNEEFDSFLVLDVEATCEKADDDNPRLAFAYPNEIIELPVLLLQWKRTYDEETEQERWELVVVDEFHSFVRPTWAPRLSAFCTELTGIQQVCFSSLCKTIADRNGQSDLIGAPTYSQLLKQFQANFLVSLSSFFASLPLICTIQQVKHGLFTKGNQTAFVTDGPWDLRDFIAKASHISRTPRPAWLAGPMVDLRILTAQYFSSLDKARKDEKRRSRSPSPLYTDLPTPAPIPTTSSTPLSPHLPPFIPPLFHTLSRSPSSTPSVPTLSSVVPTLPSIVPTLSSSKAPASLSISSVLLSLELEPFIGRLHSGLADARNCARILVELARRGHPLLGNRIVPEGGRMGPERHWGWMGKGGRVNWIQFRDKERARAGGRSWA